MKADVCTLFEINADILDILSYKVSKSLTLLKVEILVLVIPYYGVFLYGIHVCVLQMEINEASGDQSA